jgi:hypothetical protein
MTQRILLTALLLLAGSSAMAQKSEFSTENAMALLTTLAGDIGPRPMGSPAEQRALAFAASKFKEYGCQESYVMPFTVAGGVNTKSGIAVGILKGKTGRIILIGGHIDSSGPDVPGADDDGSGAASVMEIARVMGQRDHNSTFVFCCWGGEEMGLRGSEYFVDHFAQMDSIDLMFQIDMADGSGLLELDPEGGNEISAPRWLVEAGFEIFYNQLHYENLYYQTQSMTINSVGKGATGSDHMPFIKKGIPALDFTSDVSYPIHSPLDNLQTFNPSGLKRSGDLVVALADRFDGGIPSRTTEKYWLLQLGTVPHFFSHGLLLAFELVVLALAIFMLVRFWLTREKVDRATKIRGSGLKVLLVLFIIQVCAWSSNLLITLLNGVRFAWVNNYAGFVVFGAVAGLIGFWLGLQILNRLRLATDPNPYFVRAIVILLLFTLGMLTASVELAIYPAAALLLVALMGVVKDRWVRLLMLLAAVAVIWKLIFFEALGLIQHGFMSILFDAIWKGLLYHLAYAVLFTVISLPFAYAGVAVYKGASSDMFALNRFRTWWGLAATSLVLVLLAIFLAGRDSYDKFWQPTVRVQETLKLGSDTMAVDISSGEYMSGVHLVYGGKDTTLRGRVNTFTMRPAIPPSSIWPVIIPALSETQANDSLRSVSRRLEINSAVPPFTVLVSYRSQQAFEASSEWAHGGNRRAAEESDRLKSYYWYSFPQMPLVIPVTFTLKPGQKLVERVEIVYDSLAYPVQLQRPLTVFTKRMVVSKEDTLQ